MFTVVRNQVNGIGNASAVNVVIIITVKQFDVSGIEVVNLIVFDKCTAGICTVCIDVAVRKQKRFFLFVMDEVFCSDMSPQFQVSVDVERIVLIINMVDSFELA